MTESAPHNTTHSCPSIVAGTGVAYPHTSLPFSQISSPVCLLNAAQAEPMIAPSQGIHVVLDQNFLPGESALLVPKTRDGRVLFAIPWHEALHRLRLGQVLQELFW